MGKIQGPIVLHGRQSLAKTARDMIASQKITIKLPFQASGFKCSKMPEGVTKEMIEKGEIRRD